MFRASELPERLNAGRYVLPVVVETEHGVRTRPVHGCAVGGPNSPCGDGTVLLLDDVLAVVAEVKPNVFVRFVDPVPVVSLLRTYRDQYVTKYSSPFAAYLDLTDEGTSTSWGDVDGPGLVSWHGGRHLLVHTSQGFVEHVKLNERPVDGVHAYNLIRDAFPDVAAWEDQEALEAEEALYGHDWHGWRDEN